MFPGTKGSKRDGFSTVTSKYYKVPEYNSVGQTRTKDNHAGRYLGFFMLVGKSKREQEGEVAHLRSTSSLYFTLVFPFDLRCFGIRTKVEMLNPLNMCPELVME